MITDLLFTTRMLGMSLQQKSLSSPRKEGEMDEFSLLTSSCLTRGEGPEGMSPDRTIFKDSFFLEENGEFGFRKGTDAAAIAHHFI